MPETSQNSQQKQTSSYHLDPCATDGNKPTFIDELFHLLIQCRIVFLHPFKLLCLKQHC